MQKKIFIIVIITLVLIGCSSKNNNKELSEIKPSPETLYIEGMNYLNNNEYEKANIKFKEIQITYPLSNESVQSQIMSALIDYLSLEYETAIFKYNRIIQKYPSHKDIAYVYYMKAICFFEQIRHEQLDNNYNLKALDNFNQILTRFPNSDYAKDAELKIILVKQNIAAKHMDIGRFYLKNQKYIAAINRFKIVIEDYSETKFTPEALYRLVEIYYKIGMDEDAIKTAAVIAHNYPESKWYELSYKLVGPKNKNTNILDKIKNLF